MSAASATIERLTALYGEPNTPNPRQFVVEFEKALAGYSAEVLEAATDRVVRQATFWPRPAEIIAAARAIHAEQTRPIDWDAIEAERRQGWAFADLSRSARGKEARARVQAMVDDLKRLVTSKRIDAVAADPPASEAAAPPSGARVDPYRPNWVRGQRPGFARQQREGRSGMHDKLK